MRCLLIALLLGATVLVALPVPAAAAGEGCAETRAKVDALSASVSSDMRRLRREIAALRTELEEPGMSEAVAGLGYICGLFGVAFFVAGRRRKE